MKLKQLPADATIVMWDEQEDTSTTNVKVSYGEKTKTIYIEVDNGL